MLDISVLSLVATQLMSGDQVEVESQRLRVRRTSSRPIQNRKLRDGRSRIRGHRAESRHA